MAEMIPTQIPSVARQEEKTIFEILNHGPLSRSENWVIFHSIKVPRRGSPSRLNEIHFVILIPNLWCVICIFVKPSSTQSIWDKINSLFVSYPNLAKDITEDLRSLYSASHFRDDSPLSLGYAVVSPDLDSRQLTIITPSHIKSGTFDILETTLKDYAADDLAAELWEDFEEPHTSENWKDWAEFWDKAQEELLVKLRSDLESSNIPTKIIYRDNMETLRSQLLRLTEDQVSSLDHVEINDRCVIDGAAGTGKTVLAKELAKRRCKVGDTVGLLCSNRYLSYDFEKWAATISNESSGKIIAGTPATLPGKIFEKDGTLFEKHERRLNASRQLQQTLRSGSVDEGWKTFINDTVNDLKQIIDNTDTDPGKGGIFDYLILDEAQNLCDEVFLELMDVLLKHGLAEGKWTMFGDFIYQNIVTLGRTVYGKDIFDGRDVLTDFGDGLHWSNDKLETNCRNTQQISDAVAKLLNIHSLPRSGVHGPHVQIQLYDGLERLNNMLNDSISSWINKGFNSKDIMLLSSGTDNVFGDIIKEYGDEYGGKVLRSLHEFTEDHRGDSSEGNAIRYSDVYDYQGLESDFVVLVMPETPENVKLAGGTVLTQVQHLDRVLYTGMSRAHTMLIIFAHKNYKTILQRRWPDYDW